MEINQSDIKDIHNHFTEMVADSLCKLIKYEFPKIENLHIIIKDDIFEITFDEGIFGKKEVENRINDIRNRFKKP